MTKAFDIRDLRAHLRCFAFLVHEKPVKLTMNDSKDTKKFGKISAPRRPHSQRGVHNLSPEVEVNYFRSCDEFCPN